jgi:NAD(P)H dehydrogenase (quinone)
VKAYLVYCHPDPESFTASVRDRVVAALQAGGHEVRVSDLYADAFQPAMSLQERLDNRQATEPTPEIAAYCDHLRWCDTLVFVYPTWWSGQPAMLKGWFDRVLLRGVAWDLVQGSGLLRPRLTNVRRLISVTSHGSGWFVNMVEGAAGRRIVGRAVRVLCHRRARTTWLAMYNMDRSRADDRTEFLDRVERRLSRL